MENLKLPIPLEWSIVIAIVFYLARSIWQLIEANKARDVATMRSDRTHEDAIAPGACSTEVLVILQQQTQILSAVQQTLAAFGTEQQRQARVLTMLAAQRNIQEET